MTAKDYVSLQKTRYHKRLQELVKKVLKEDEKGALSVGDFSQIAFLEPYTKEW